MTFSNREKGIEQRAWNNKSTHKTENDRLWKDCEVSNPLQDILSNSPTT